MAKVIYFLRTCFTISLLGHWDCLALAEGEVLFGGGMNRNTPIVRGDYSFALFGDLNGKASGWFIEVAKGKEKQWQEIVIGKKNVVLWGEDRIEISHEQVTSFKEERTNMMMETVGVFKIVLGKLSLKPYSRKEPYHSQESVVVGNGLVALRTVPANKGAIVGLSDETEDYNFLCEGGDLRGKTGCGGMGWIELLSGLTDMIDDETSYSVEKKDEQVVLRFKGQFKNAARFERVLTVGGNSSAFSIVSSMIPNIDRECKVRHRSEMKLVDWFGCQKDDQVQRMRAQPGDCEFRGAHWLAANDERRKTALVSVYGPEHFESLYVWIGDFFTWEAWTGRIALKAGEKLSLSAKYFIMRGLDGISEVNENGVVDVRTDKGEYGYDQRAKIRLGIGLAEGRKVVWQLIVADPLGKEVFSRKDAWQVFPGVMRFEDAAFNTKLKDGEYQVRLRLADSEGKTLLAGQQKLIVNQQLTEAANKLMQDLDKAIQKLKATENRTREIKSQIFDLEKLRMAAADAIQAGDLNKAIQLIKSRKE